MEEQQRQDTVLDLDSQPGAIATTPKLTMMEQPWWQEWVDPTLNTIGKIPDYIGQVFADYKQPLLTIGIIVLALITVKITLAVLTAIDGIPLLAPILELVGLVFSGWFVYRYLWKASSRQELVSEFDALKNQIFGG